jgi:putative redox protein
MSLKTIATLEWKEGLLFDATSGQAHALLDSDGIQGPSPVQALVMAMAGCMAMDVAAIVTKGRHDLRGLTTTVTAERASEPPRRVLAISMHFILTGVVPQSAVERALDLSRGKYCSVWHSMRQDIPLTTTFEIRS